MEKLAGRSLKILNIWFSNKQQIIFYICIDYNYKMRQLFITTFFSAFFFMAVIAPSMKFIYNLDYEVSLVENSNEQESNSEEITDIETVLLHLYTPAKQVFYINQQKELNLCFKLYKSVPKDHFLPPPKRLLV